jgi:hypothetical protein
MLVSFELNNYLCVQMPCHDPMSTPRECSVAACILDEWDRPLRGVGGAAIVLGHDDGGSLVCRIKAGVLSSKVAHTARRRVHTGSHNDLFKVDYVYPTPGFEHHPAMCHLVHPR